jgi:hypothetical protein
MDAVDYRYSITIKSNAMLSTITVGTSYITSFIEEISMY